MDKLPIIAVQWSPSSSTPSSFDLPTQISHGFPLHLHSEGNIQYAAAAGETPLPWIIQHGVSAECSAFDIDQPYTWDLTSLVRFGWYQLMFEMVCAKLLDLSPTVFTGSSFWTWSDRDWSSRSSPPFQPAVPAVPAASACGESKQAHNRRHFYGWRLLCLESKIFHSKLLSWALWLEVQLAILKEVTQGLRHQPENFRKLKEQIGFVFELLFAPNLPPGECWQHVKSAPPPKA